MPVQNLYQQLEALDAEYFTTAVTTTHASVKDAVMETLAETAPQTLEAAQAATAPLVQDAVTKAPEELKPVITAFAPMVISSLTTNLFNWGFGKLFGAKAETAAEGVEQQNPLVQGYNGGQPVVQD